MFKGLKRKQKIDTFEELKKPSKGDKKQRTIENGINYIYKSRVTDVFILRLQKELEQRGLINDSADSDTLEKFVAACADAIENIQNSDPNCGDLYDPESRLTLPPMPKIMFKDRSSKYGSKVDINTFIKNEPWGKFRDAGLLYSEHIRLLDPSLFYAINNRATTENKKCSELMKSLGILTRMDLVNPTKSESRKAEMIKLATLRIIAAQRCEPDSDTVKEK
ncbi:MAG: hypothetical protein ABL901_10130 [Hyphomicrobiaceae bacterium]